eukprot:TRINITY_DN16549_c0_g2_i2.p1 TRINITY_DN16549_c0_g2~~TRINITY_DN16549_c0_g2_i2.p1  ORF type:complete len:1053 (+),score=408.10 TRINITY_DN16549_c0_g2_i2:56-3160(+)
MPGRVDEWRDSVVVPPSTQTTPGRANGGRKYPPPAQTARGERQGQKSSLAGKDAGAAAAARPQSAPTKKAPALRPIGRMQAPPQKNRFQYQGGGVNSDRAFITKLKGEILKVQRRIDALQSGGEEVTNVSQDMRDLEQRLFHYQYDADPGKLMKVQVGLLEMLFVGMKNLAASLTLALPLPPTLAQTAPAGGAARSPSQAAAANPASTWGTPMQGGTAKALRAASAEPTDDSRVEPMIGLVDFVCEMVTSMAGSGTLVTPRSTAAATPRVPQGPSPPRASTGAHRASLPLPIQAPARCSVAVQADEEDGGSERSGAQTPVGTRRASRMTKDMQQQVAAEMDRFKKGKVAGYGFAGLDVGFLEAQGVAVPLKHSQLSMQEAGFLSETLEGLLATVRKYQEVLDDDEAAKAAAAAQESPRPDDAKSPAKAKGAGKDAKGGKDAAKNDPPAAGPTDADVLKTREKTITQLHSALALQNATLKNMQSRMREIVDAAGPTDADVLKTREKTITQLHSALALQNATLKNMQSRMREIVDAAGRKATEDANTITALRVSIATLREDVAAADQRSARGSVDLRRQLEEKDKEVARLTETVRVMSAKRGAKVALVAHKNDPPGEDIVLKSMVKRINEQSAEIDRHLAEIDGHKAAHSALQLRFNEVQRDHSSLQRLLQSASMQNTEHSDVIKELKAEADECRRIARERMEEVDSVRATKEADEDVIRKTSIELDICRSTIAMLRQRETELLSSSDEKEWKCRYVREEADEVKKKVVEENTRLQLEIEQLRQTAMAYERSEQELRERLHATEKVEKKLMEREQELDSLQRDFKNFTLSKARQGEASAEDERRLQECLIMMNTDLFNLPEGATKEDLELMTEQLEGKRRRLLAEQAADKSFKSHMAQIVDMLKGKMNVIQMYAFKEKRKMLQTEDDLASTKHLLQLSRAEHKSEIAEGKKVALKLKTESDSLASTKQALVDSNAMLATVNARLHDRSTTVKVLEQRVAAQQSEIVTLAVEVEKAKGPKSSVRPLSAGSATAAAEM